MKGYYVLINFKAYDYAAGKKAVEMSKICDSFSRKSGVRMIVSPQHVDLPLVAISVKIPVFAQSIDPMEPGAHTGSVTAFSVKEAGARGTFINHSEKRIGMEEIGQCVGLARKYRLLSLCCVQNLEEARRVLKFGPDFMAYEPPEFIGTKTSVSEAKPEIVKGFAELVGKKSIPLAGAGVHCREDVKNALDFGMRGVLFASAFSRSKNKRKFLEELTSF